MVQPPVIFVPGITATSLEDYYPIPPEEVWTAVLYKRYERISLHPDDIRYEAIEPARVGPYSLFGLIYEDLIEALRHDLAGTRDNQHLYLGSLTTGGRIARDQLTCWMNLSMKYLRGPH